ncbi:MAG: hypothetical protein JXD23_11390 [Spirochaetales bacterium]|nr:hypothetical protein [Spirochaetales bacterium]
MNRADLRNLISPFWRLGVVAVAAAAVIVTVGLATGPVIEDRLARGEKELLRAAAGGLAPGERYAAFPLTMSRTGFAERILASCPDDEARRRISACYEILPDDTVGLKQGLPESDRTALSLLVSSIGYRNEGTVRAYYPVESSGSLTGFVLELSVRGFGGGMKLLAYFGRDGVVRNAVLAEEAGRGPWRERAKAVRLLGLFAGAKGREVPVTRESLTGAGADAVTGATVTFRGLGLALREGSRFAARMGGF